MVSEYGLKLAVHLITTHFGNIVANVCDNLLRKGPLTLEQLIRFTELKREQVKNSLLVLVQHNCVQPFQNQQQQDGAKTEYMALFDNILHRPRFPKFLDIVSRKLDDECVELLDGLLRNGRLTLQQMADRASEGKENPVAIDVVRETLRKLLAARYVERCPAPEPVLFPVVEETTTRKRGARAAKIFQPPLTIEERVLEASVPGESIRFSLTADTGFNADGETNSDDCPMTSAEDVVKEELTPWRANFEEFMRHLRHKALIENVRTRLDEGAATILSAILDATRTAEKKVKVQNSVPLSLEAIFTEVVKSENGRTMTIDRVKASLVQLGCPSRMPDDSYTIDLKNIIELARNDEVESIVLKRYGPYAYRMFRLLSKANCFLETDKIAESTLVEKKEAPKLLYGLWKDNYLHMEKLQVMASKQSRFVMWKVNKPLLWDYVLNEMYHAALNLNLRLGLEQEKDGELLSVPLDKINESKSLQKKFERRRRVRLLLGSSLMKLDDALMLFHDF
ncbi:PREDICTED: DNA-directed RNA polymerase III subunit RPC3 isoform X1 [Lupinus angustifolius]|uniref:DNA-directed RNA polymerase III subunit RPC3 isoform X1 n=1 Tax=Lupinus angustifolius TaxID=3871 RepID=UPI00092F564D|nr:PREDICTED: DNA-directed RNA polymerase III subunit RPC3 isoform X1 [Lupinus angustifolius]